MDSSSEWYKYLKVDPKFSKNGREKTKGNGVERTRVFLTIGSFELSRSLDGEHVGAGPDVQLPLPVAMVL